MVNNVHFFFWTYGYFLARNGKLYLTLTAHILRITNITPKRKTLAKIHIIVDVFCQIMLNQKPLFLGEINFWKSGLFRQFLATFSIFSNTYISTNTLIRFGQKCPFFLLNICTFFWLIVVLWVFCCFLNKGWSTMSIFSYEPMDIFLLQIGNSTLLWQLVS